MIRAEQTLEARALGEVGQDAPVSPRDTLLSFDHEACTHGGSLSAMTPETETDPQPDRFLTERQRGMRAAVLGAAFGLVLAFLGRRR